MELILVFSLGGWLAFNVHKVLKQITKGLHVDRSKALGVWNISVFALNCLKHFLKANPQSVALRALPSRVMLKVSPSS